MPDSGRWFAVSASAKDRSVGTRARQKTPQERVQERDRLIEVALKLYFVKCFNRLNKEKLYVYYDPKVDQTASCSSSKAITTQLGQQFLLLALFVLVSRFVC